MPHP
jgi:hypothetical protein